MTRKDAIEAIKCNWPDSRYTILREALDMAVKALEDVPVVRCRECKHCDSTIFNGNFIGFCKIRKDSYGAKLRVGLSDYCSDGERKEGADND